MNEYNRPALSVTKLLHPESTFEQCVDYTDIAGLLCAYLYSSILVLIFYMYVYS